MFETLKSDVHRYGDTPYERFRAILLTTQLWATIIYRYRRWVRTQRNPLLAKLLTFLGTLLQLWIDIATDIELPPSAEIGPGLYIAHSGDIILSSRAVLGRHCTLAHGVTVGHSRGGSRNVSGAPIIGDRTYIGPGAAILGPITIGEDALIGVAAVVTRDVPPRGVVAGNPARLLSQEGSFELVIYPGMESDYERLASLALRSSRWQSNEDKPLR